MNPESEFYATISWNEYIVNGKVAAPAGEFTIYRNRLDWLVEGTIEYLAKWKGRGAYLETASEEYEFGSIIDRTEYVKSQLKGSK